MDYHLLRSFTLAMHVHPHDKTLENHITFPKESENTTLSTCKHRCLNRECAEYTIYYYQCIQTSHRLRFKSKLCRTRQKKTGKQTYTDYVVLAIWAIWGQNFGRRHKNGRKCDWASANFTPWYMYHDLSQEICNIWYNSDNYRSLKEAIPSAEEAQASTVWLAARYWKNLVHNKKCMSLIGL